MVPAIITVPCPIHDAEVGELCFREQTRGVCGDRIEFCAERIKARAALR